jgi:hypothetical protein
VFEVIVRLYGVDGKGILNRAAIAQLPAIEDVEGCKLAEVAAVDPVFEAALGEGEDGFAAGKSGFEALYGFAKINSIESPTFESYKSRIPFLTLKYLD